MYKNYLSDVEPSHTTGAAPIERRGPVQEMVIRHTEEYEELEEMETNLEHLTMGILDISTDGLSRRYQCQPLGVSGCFGGLLHRVARVVMCFHEHEHED